MGKPPLQRVEELFHRAVDLDPAERAAMLESECSGDHELHAAVEDLLEHADPFDRTEAFIVSPIQRDRDPALALVTGFEETAAPPRPGPPGYELLELLGEGGMGVVFKARQESLNRLVALKMLLSGPVAPEQLARFRTEAESLARLQHPNVIQIHEVGDFEGRPYLVMEYVAGPTLARDLNHTPQPPRRAAELLQVLAGAVQAVHDCGILHRDLKPANILLAHRTVEPGPQPLVRFTPKIADFGLAKRLGEDASQRSGGVAWGTPSYMAPEQASLRYDLMGPATDVYALGAILYEVLTGRPPFEGGSVDETLIQVVTEEPLSPARLRSTLPRDLVTICLKCLEKEPPKRYDRATDLAEDLRRYLAGEPITARRAGIPERIWRWCHRRPLVAALGLLSTLLAGALLAMIFVYQSMRLQQTEQKLKGAETEAEQKGQVAELERRQLSRIHRAMGLRKLEDGDPFAALLWLVAALRFDEDRPEATEDRGDIARALKGCPRLLSFFNYEQQVIGVEHDGANCRVATIEQGGTIGIRDTRTGRTRLLHGALDTQGAGRSSGLVTISLDGSLVAVIKTDTNQASTRVWDLKTERPLTAELHHKGQVVDAAFSDNAYLIAHLSDHSVEVWDLQKQERVAGAGAKAKSPPYAQASSNSKWVFTLAADGIATVGPVIGGRPADVVVFPGKLSHPVRTAAVRGDGRQIAIVGAENRVWIWNTATGKEQLLLQGHPLGGEVKQVQWSPDGRRLLTIAAPDRVQVWDIATERAATPPLPHPGALHSASFAGNDTVVTVGVNGAARVWQLPGLGRQVLDTGGRNADTLRLLAEVLSAQRLDADGRLLPLELQQLRSEWELWLSDIR
jgi:WD40 repeat protein/tRNA A-37 threonylcarbamoyl transferase component Bud32